MVSSIWLIYLKGEVSSFACVPCKACRGVQLCVAVIKITQNNDLSAPCLQKLIPWGLEQSFQPFRISFFKMWALADKILLSIIYHFGPQSFCWNRKGATSAEFCGVITVPSSIKSAHTLCVGSWWNGVIAGLPFRLYQHCLWTGTAVGRGQTTVATAMAAFQRCIGKPERWRQQQRHWERGSCFTLFQDIIEPI